MSVRLTYRDGFKNHATQENPKDGIIQVGEIIEKSDYYPFGLKQKDDDLPDYSIVNKYKYAYGGKELNDELGLDLYDFGARNYDPALGRWLNIDPLAEVSRRWTPYNYAYNNPIYFVDPDGRLSGSFNNGYFNIDIVEFGGAMESWAGGFQTEESSSETQGDGWIKSVKDGEKSYTYDKNVNTVEQAVAANYQDVEEVQPGYNLSIDGSYSYDLNQDGTVTNTSDGSNIQFHKPLVGDNGLIVGGAFQTAGGSKIYTNNVGEVGGNTFPRASGAITDDSLNFTANLFAIGEIYNGGKLIYMGLTTIPKSSVGIRTVLGASKNTLRSSVYFENRIGQKAINIFGVKSLPTLYGKSYTWGTFYGRNASLIGAGRVGIGGAILNN